VIVMRKSTCACGVWVWVSGNNIGEEGAKALGPHLAKLVNMNTLGLAGRKRGCTFPGSGFMSVACTTGNGFNDWQLQLLHCDATVPERLAALQHLPQESPWRQAVVRYDRRLWEHLPDEASAWQDDDSAVADESKEAPDDAPHQSGADLQSLSASVAVQVACYVNVATATSDATPHDVTAAQDVLVAITKLSEELQLLTSVALQHREKAEARLALARQQQHAMHALDQAVRQAQTDVEVAVARVHAAAAGTERDVLDDAVHRRRTVVEAATAAVQGAVDECTGSGMTEADVSSCAAGAAAQALLVELRRDAETSDLVQKAVEVRCCQVYAGLKSRCVFDCGFVCGCGCLVRCRDCTKISRHCSRRRMLNPMPRLRLSA